MRAVTKEVEDRVEGRRRSPSVPFIGIGVAGVRARELYDRVQREWVSVGDAAAAWGLSAKSSAGLQIIAALLGYGLVESTGRGEARQIRISDLAGRVFGEPPLSSEAQQRAISEMALKPKLLADYAARWLDGRPPDAICIEGLKLRHGFTEAAAARFLGVFDESMWVVRGGPTAPRRQDNSEAGANPSLNGPLPAPRVKLGDYVQWSSEGVDRLPVPRKVVWLSDGGRYLSVEGSLTRFSAAEVRIVAPPPALPSAHPEVLLANYDLAEQNGEVPKIVQRGSRLEISADLDLEGLHRLKHMLPLYREILILTVPKTAEAAEPELETGESNPDQAEGTEEQHRPAVFPILGFHWAVQYARWLYDYAERRAVSMTQAAIAWELDLESDTLLKTVDGLLEFGLIEQSGSGKSRKICLTELGWRIFRRADPELAHQAFLAAAGKPKLLREYAMRWRVRRPEDAVCIAELVKEHGFSEKMAAQFLWVFKETAELIYLGESRLNADPGFEQLSSMLDSQPQNKLMVVQRGCRIEIMANVDVAGLDKLRDTLAGYASILQLWDTDREAGLET